MTTAETYVHAILWACLPAVLFAVVSDRRGMNRVTRLVCLRVLWCLPLSLSALMVACGVMILAGA